MILAIQVGDDFPYGHNGSCTKCQVELRRNYLSVISLDTPRGPAGFRDSEAALPAPYPPQKAGDPISGKQPWVMDLSGKYSRDVKSQEKELNYGIF